MVCRLSLILKTECNNFKTKLMKRNHFLIFLLACFFWVACRPANERRTIYVVRHAEKDTGSNPALSAAGQARAGALYRKLKDSNIDVILVTQYRRTALTGDSLRIYNHIDTLHYDADTTALSLFEKINRLPPKMKHILVIAHSNTIPAIIRKAGIKGFAGREIPDYAYDNLFIIQQNKDTMMLHQEAYGATSEASSMETKMRLE